MKIVKDYPPNFEAIKKQFNPPPGVVFTYGDTLFSPQSEHISEDLMVHEELHSVQQANDPAKWWDNYFKDVHFRLDQEVKAYQNQWYIYKVIHKDRNERARFLHKIAGDLSGSIYGNIISYEEAVKKINSL